MSDGAMSADAWFYLAIWTEEMMFNEDPMILGRCDAHPDYLPVGSDLRYFFRVRDKAVAERLVRLFKKSHIPKYEEDGDTRFRMDFSCRDASEFEEDERFLIEEEISAAAEKVSRDEVDSRFPLSSECLFRQASIWLSKLSTNETSTKSPEPESRRNPELLRRFLPTTIVAAMGVRDLSRMLHFYPNAIPAAEAKAIHDGFVSAFESFLGHTGLPPIEIYQPPEIGHSATTDEMMTVIIAALLLNHPDCALADRPEDEQSERVQSLVQTSHEQCESSVRKLVERLGEVMLFDCRIPEPQDDPTYRESRRFFQMLRRYWHQCRRIVMQLVNAPIGFRPHPLATILINVKDRINTCIDSISDWPEGGETRATIFGLVEMIIEGDPGDLSMADEWTLGEVQKVDSALDTLRLRLGSGAYPLTHQEELWFRHVDGAIDQHDADVKKEWSRVVRSLEAKRDKAVSDAEVAELQSPSANTGLIIDEATFSVQWASRDPLTLGNTKMFRLLHELAKEPNRFISFTELAERLGGDSMDDIAPIKSRLSNALKKGGYGDLAAGIETQKGHYGLFLEGAIEM